MGHGKGFFNRLIVFIFALAAAAICAWSIGLFVDTEWSEKINKNVDFGWLEDFHSNSDYQPWLIGIAAGLIILGVIFIFINIERRRVGQGPAKASTPEGVITVGPADIGSAVAQELANIPGVRAGSTKAVTDRGEDFLDINLRVSSSVDLQQLREQCQQASVDIIESMPSQDISPRFRVQVDHIPDQ